MARSFASSSARPGSGPAAAVPRVYLDYAGFSPVDPRVVAVMRPFLEGGVGNPGAPHSLGLEARAQRPREWGAPGLADRHSTRLNSSQGSTSHAVLNVQKQNFSSRDENDTKLDPRIKPTH